MKKFVRDVIVDMLSYLSRRTIRKYKPVIIAVTGNIGKTTTKDYIYSFLKSKFSDTSTDFVRASLKSENSEFGVNLTILGEKNAWNNGFAWLKIILRNLWRLAVDIDYPKILVLEVGADHPGDIKYITSIIKPDVVVLTAFQKSPTHGEFFSSIDQHINEKKVLVEKIKKDGIIVYNLDDEVMTKMAEEKQGKNKTVRLISFGYSQNANVVILENGNLYSEDSELLGTKIKLGIRFESLKDEIELRIPGVVGQAHAYSMSAAVAVSLLNEFDKNDFQNAQKNFERYFDLAKSRMRLLPGINNSLIIDDSYNSSPKAAKNAIDTASKILCKGKKIAILGHMAELGEKTSNAHFQVAQQAAKVFDVIVFSGKYNEFYLEGIRELGVDLSKVFLAENSKEVLEIVKKNSLVKENDLILVKGSQSSRLEKVVVQLLVNPRDRSEVCRQDKEWNDR